MVPTVISAALPWGALVELPPLPPALPLLHALRTVDAPAATVVAIRKFLREKDMATCLDVMDERETGYELSATGRR
ncbi:hypothetical protein GCM10022232_03790 [Streptomyces plumbiresistens]|uniref:Uncharacterized protein n=1 Tax=Streptomyces plumbiresistens TaxID=511811 RepID=A0ABP7Q3H6_9ACTN